MTVPAAAHALRNSVVFQNTSLRHLTDLVELGRHDVRYIPVDATVVIPAVFLVVLRGSALAPPFFSLVPGQVFWTGIVPIVTREDLTAESTTEGPRAAAFTFVLEDVRAQVRGTAGEGTVVLPLRKTILESAARASTSFGVSVDLTPIADRQLTLLQFFIEENEHVRAAPDRSA